jgi:pyrroline-5-carboxylate reductase
MKNNQKTKENIAVIGNGVMGSMLIKILKNLKYNVLGLDKGDDITQAESCDVVIIAVKPQDFKSVELKLKKDTLVISIMAGASVETIKNHLKVNKIIRAMPNMSARIQKGFTGWFATKSVSSDDKAFAQKLFNAMGESMQVNTEDTINKVTAISASGSGFVFYMLNAYINGAKSLGIKDKDAKKMALQTFIGALAMLDESSDLELLVKKVASKGGTTEAGLKELKKIDKIFSKTLSSAYKRALKLSK